MTVLDLAEQPVVADVRRQPGPRLARPRATSINGETMRAREVQALRESAAYFGLPDAEAARQFDEIVDGVGNWREVAAGHGIGPVELERSRLCSMGWPADSAAQPTSEATSALGSARG